VVEIVLTPESPLGGYARSFGETRLAEVAGLGLVAAAIPPGGERDSEEALRARLFCTVPQPGRYTVAQDGSTRVLWTAPGQLLLMLPHDGTGAAEALEPQLGGALRLTELSDAYSVLALEGPLARPALERICPLDLHAQAFGPDHAARTLMEHISATILRIGEDGFRLLSPRSTARDFCHAVEVSLANVAP